MDADASADASDAYDALVRENRELIGRTVARLEKPPTALEFARDWLGRNVPFVCAGAIETWNARDGRWDTREGLERALGGADAFVGGVNRTPNGRADAVYYRRDARRRLGRNADDDDDGSSGVMIGGGDGDDDDRSDLDVELVDADRFDASVPLFLEPESSGETRVGEFLDSLERRPASERRLGVNNVGNGASVVAYLSEQNDNLRTRPALRGMFEDIGEVDFAAETFAREPDAVNLWIGDEASTTSWHKDYYENIYSVIRGEKIFNLRPPCEVGLMRYVDCVPGVFEWDADAVRWRVQPRLDAARVAWSADDIDPKTLRPMFGHSNAVDDESDTGKSFPPSIDVVVRAGETLYLPAMWLHRVSQRGLTVAVNSWYDMEFGDRFAYAEYARCTAPRRF